MNTMRLRWQRLLHAWEVFARSQRPWEQEGSLRWVKPALGEWELHGSTVPLDVEAERTPIWSPRTGVRW